MSLIVLDIDLTLKTIVKELEIFLDGNAQGFSFCPLKIYKPNKQTTWNTNHLHGIACSSWLEHDKLFDACHEINTLNAEVFVEGTEKCKFVPRLPGQNVRNLDDCGVPKNCNLIVAEEERNASLICFSYPFGQKSALHCAGKESDSVCRMGYALFNFVNFVPALCFCECN